MILEKINYPQDLKSLSIKELETLSEEIREFLISKVTKTGGHLSPNLGVVELTIALHYVFNSPEDDFIWDVGHQSYVHKILTGRKNKFDFLRNYKGISGYPSPSESKYDVIHAGHSSTSLSIASGIAKSKVLKSNFSSKTIAIIGDGAFTAGLVYEALNTISHEKLPVIIILNDNGWSISKNVGGISKYFKKISSSNSYVKFKRRIEFILNRIPWIGTPLKRVLYQLKETLKDVFIPGKFFEDIDIKYIGPLKGHDIKELIKEFEKLKNIKSPVLVHILTKKGKGFKPSETDPTGYHGISGLSINGDDSIPLKAKNDSFSKIFGKKVIELGKQYPNLVTITAAMKTGTGLTDFAKLFPKRFIDVGIAEQHAVDMAVGLSLKGYIPIVAIYSTFLQRAFDQLIHDVAIAKSKIIFCLDRAGLVPGDGETHQGIFDIAYLKMIPGFTIFAPATGKELSLILDYAIENINGPIAIRWPKDEASEISGYNCENKDISQPIIIDAINPKLIILTFGRIVKNAIALKNKALQNGFDIKIINIRQLMPINENVVNILSKDEIPVLILEEGIKKGGIGEEIALSVLSKRCKKVDIIAIDNEFPFADERENLLSHYKLTSDKLWNKIKEYI